MRFPPRGRDPRAGEAATFEAPFAWLSMEGGADPLVVELRLTTWPGRIERRLAVVNAHGGWIDWG
jgi:hypothetical protein